jgi:predicted O-linked N-acetylglucosamine transferase (SPINDLY family)
VNPSTIDAELERAVTLHRQGRLEEARAQYQSVLRVQPRCLRAVRLLAGVFMKTGRADRAVDLLTAALQSDPQDAALHTIHAAALFELGQHQAAISSSERALALDADAIDAHFIRGNALLGLERHGEAIMSYDRVVAADVRNPWAWSNRGIALYELKRPRDAIASYDRALALMPDDADMYYNRGNALRSIREWRNALDNYDAAIARNPRHENAHLNRGTTLLDLKQPVAAIESYDRVIALNARNALAHGNRGAALLRAGRPQAAVESLDRAIELHPQFGDAHFNRGNALRELKQYSRAVDSYDRALATGCATAGLPGLRLNSKLQVCDWHGLAADLEALSAAIERGEPASDPFFVLSLLDSPRLQTKAAQSWVRATVLPRESSPPTPRRRGKPRIRLGYFSSDFRNHPVAILSAGLFEHHDRSTFDVIALELGAPTRCEMRSRLQAAVDQFVELESMSDEDAARLARNLEIDIAVDLSGFTSGARPGIFASRAAPLQLGYLGFTGSMGAGFMDYLVADRTVIPVERRGDYAEKIIHLPNSFQVNDGKRRISEKIFDRSDLGLPADAFVFCCFNNTSKILPESFDGWMRILAHVDNAVLWLLDDNSQASGNLRKEAAARGVSGDRLIFAPRIGVAEHLARHRCADLFLDSLPFNAHSTASDALWAGLPVLTRPGAAFSGRVAASLLRAVGLPQLIAPNQEQYEKLAVDLATNPLRLDQIRRALAVNKLTKPLFDTRLFTHQLESAYRAIIERHDAGLAPEHLDPTQESATSMSSAGIPLRYFS